MRPGPAIAGAILGLVATFPAWAAEDEVVISLSGGYALLTKPEAQHRGGNVSGAAWLGMTDEFWLAVSGGAGLHSGGTNLWEAVGGLVMAVDVLRTIPFLEAMLGVVGRRDVVPTVRLGLGADYLLTPTIALGVVARYRPLAKDLGNHWITASARISFRIEL